MTLGRLRIIAGSLRGRRILVPPGEHVRPTPERVREALFSILGGRLEGAAVLDAFAGTGALGIEALSRGALRAVFVEIDPRVAGLLRHNLVATGMADRARVLVADALGAPERADLGGPFDLILADPPYGAGLDEGFLEAVGRSVESLAPGGLLAIERATGSGPPGACSEGLRHLRGSRYGTTRIDLWTRADPT